MSRKPMLRRAQLKASLRRLKASMAPEIPRDAVISELRKILKSEGVANLLAHGREGYFARVLSRAKECAERSHNDDIFDRLDAILNSSGLDAALFTRDPNEQPTRLRHLMLEGPYREFQLTQDRQ